MMNIFLSIILIFADENVSGVVSSPGETWFEPTVINLVSWLKLFVEMTGGIIIALGVIFAAVEFLRVLFSKTGGNYNIVRLLLARYLALALEFQLGADILSTAIAPGWDQIGKLGAIAVIRTALNYFLSREMQEERKITKTENKIDDSLKI
ncbi:MAG: DUF1622 domain-containing protein [Pyrinomonadaceae bacterium]